MINNNKGVSMDFESDGELLDWLFDLAGVTTVAELEDILINHNKQEAGTYEMFGIYKTN
jgi:hypothetical protein